MKIKGLNETLGVYLYILRKKKNTIVISENSHSNAQSAAQTHICLRPLWMLMLKKEDRAAAQSHRSMAIKLKDEQKNPKDFFFNIDWCHLHKIYAFG